MISMITIPMIMAISVPAGPATGRKVVPGMANTPQPTMQPKDIAHTSTGERYLSNGLVISFILHYLTISCIFICRILSVAEYGAAFAACLLDIIQCTVSVAEYISLRILAIRECYAYAE